MSADDAHDGKFRVVIAGGGVAALEAALALHELAGERVATTLVAPNPEFVYRPLLVHEPFTAAVHRQLQRRRDRASGPAPSLSATASGGSTRAGAMLHTGHGRSSPTTPCCWPSARARTRASATC